MDIEFGNETHCKNAEKGDLIVIGDTFYLVVRDMDGEHLRLVNLEMEWIVCKPSATIDNFENGKYRIVAKNGTFKIMRK